MAIMKLASSHYMQSMEWAKLRTANGWEIQQLPLPNDKAVHAYRKKSPIGGLVYIPGFMPARREDIDYLADQVKNQATNITCKIEPCIPLDDEVVQWFKDEGWKRARNVQYEHTVVMDLTKSEDDLWMGMKSRGRQEVNYARKAGAVIEEAACTQADFDTMHELLKTTSQRKAFGIRERQGVMKIWKTFRDAGRLRLFFAKFEDTIIAGGIFITDGTRTVWYKDAGSLPAYHKLFGPRLLLWEAALAFKKEGYQVFDLGGTPGEEDYQKSSMRGVYIFKTAYTRELTTMMPAFELPLKPLRHHAWQKLEPTAVKINRLASTLKGKIKR